MPTQLNKFSSRITQPRSQGASQAMLYATGLREEDMNKPQVGIASVWFEGNPCNMHLLQLAEKVKEGLTAVGLVGMRFNTIGVSDGISMGTDGMSFSLQSRPDCRFHRDRNGRTVVRRQHLHPRLRQKHAGLHHGDGPAQSPVADDLWRDN